MMFRFFDKSYFPLLSKLGKQSAWEPLWREHKMMSHYTMWLVFVALFGENIPEAINNEEKKAFCYRAKGDQERKADFRRTKK